MAFDAALLIRVGSGLAFIGVGLFAAFRSDGAGRAAFGAMCVAFGLAFAIYNVMAAGGATQLGLLTQSVLFVLVIATGAWFVLAGPWAQDARSRREARIVLAIGALAMILLVVLGRGGDRTAVDPWAEKLDDDTGNAMYGALLVIAFLAARRATLARDARQTRALAGLALGVAAFPGYRIGQTLSPGFVADHGVVWPALAASLVAVVVIAWLSLCVGTSPGRRSAWLPVWGMLIVLLVGMLDPDTNTSSGVVGIVRTVAALVLSLALVGGALDERARPAIVVRKGALAAAALAVLFIVAQVAQNFFSDQFGLLTGGIVAGAFLFAAQPLQRAAERILLPRPGADRPSSVGADDRAEEVYRDALRIALRDRIVSREEELHLAELGERLGISARRALELRHEIEAEAR